MGDYWYLMGGAGYTANHPTMYRTVCLPTTLHTNDLVPMPIVLRQRASVLNTGPWTPPEASSQSQDLSEQLS